MTQDEALEKLEAMFPLVPHGEGYPFALSALDVEDMVVTQRRDTLMRVCRYIMDLGCLSSHLRHRLDIEKLGDLILVGLGLTGTDLVDAEVK
mgnify:CR=1 FL=1